MVIHFQTLTLRQLLKTSHIQQAKQRFYRHYLCQSHKRYLLTFHLIYGHLTRNLCFFGDPEFLLFYRVHLAQLIQYRQINHTYLSITVHCFSSFEILTIGNFATLSHLNNHTNDPISPPEGNWLTSLLGKLYVSSLVCSLLAVRFARKARPSKENKATPLMVVISRQSMYKQYSFDSTFDFWECNNYHAMHI